MKHTRRSFLRSYREATLEIRNKNSDKSFYVKMNDCCQGGMQFAAKESLEPGSAIVIRPTDHKDGVLNGALRDGFPAEVVWCRRLADEEARHFIIGVQFVSPPHAMTHE